jgi:hypothetical protein
MKRVYVVVSSRYSVLYDTSHNLKRAYSTRRFANAAVKELNKKSTRCTYYVVSVPLYE